MSRRLREEHGQTAAEYMGLLLVVAAVIAALVTGGLGARIAEAASEQLCKITGRQACAQTGARAKPSDPSPRTRRDRDGDGLSNAQEARIGSDPNSGDSDRDGIEDGEERRLGTDPLAADSDADGIPDREERLSGGRVSPRDADSDDDGLADGEEVATGTDPSDADSDGALGAAGDGLSDAREIELGTDPGAYDTDGDFFSDGYEVENGTDPLEDERNALEKLRDAALDDPIGLALPGGGAGKGAKKVIDDFLKGSRKVPSARSVREAAEIRRERLRALRERLRAGRRRDAPALAPAEVGTAKRRVLEGATPGKVSKTAQFSKPGGFGQANADFDELARGVEVLDRGGGLRTATLQDGTKLTVRPFSSGDVPTLQIATPGEKVVKVRY